MTRPRTPRGRGNGDAGTSTNAPDAPGDGSSGTPPTRRSRTGNEAQTVLGAQEATAQAAQQGRPRAGGASRPRRRYKPNDPADPTHLRDNRPSIRVTTRRQIFRDAQRAPNGEDFICPNSGKIIPCQRDSDGNAIRYDERGRVTTDGSGFTVPAPNPPSDSGMPANYHFGHIPDSEYRRLIQLVEDHPGQITNKQFRDEYNNPSHYQIEHPDANISHGHESTSPGYGHYSHLVPSQPTSGTPPEERSSTAPATGATPAGGDGTSGTGRGPRFRR